MLAAYVTLFNVPSTSAKNWVIRPGAFADVLRSGVNIKAVVNHHMDMLVADTESGTLHIEEDDVGLLALVNPHESKLAGDLIACMRAGDIGQMSFQLDSMPGESDSFMQDGVYYREVLKVETLSEVSFVSNGQFSQTLCVVADEGWRESPHTPVCERPSVTLRRQAFMERASRN